MFAHESSSPAEPERPSRRPLGRVGLVVGMVLLLANCAALTGPDGLFGGGNPFANQTPYADYALAALARNDMQAAEQMVDQALARNPKDPYALLAAGIVYQNTGRPFRAKQAYQEVMALNPGLSATVQGWTRLQPQGLADIAANNLQALEVAGGGAAETWPRNAQMPGGLDQQQGGMGAGTGAGGSGNLPAVWGGPQGGPGGDQGAVQSRPLPGAADSGGMSGDGGLGLNTADRNAIQRFQILQKLLDEGLITEEEFQARRTANLGALTPLSTPPPSAGLDRPVPAAEQIVSRLGALRRATEMRAISPREQAVERTMILDAILPSDPIARARPASPPDGLLDAAQAVRRLEALRQAGLITSDEMAAERAAIEQAIGVGPGGAPMSSRSSGGDGGMSSGGGNPFGGGQSSSVPFGQEFSQAAPGQPQMLVPAPGGQPQSQSQSQQSRQPQQQVSGPVSDPSLLAGFDEQPAQSGWGVHLASYRSRDAARNAVSELRGQYRGLLSSLSTSVKQANLSRGTFYRLIFGPLANRAEAQSLCVQLKRRGQYCDPMMM